MMWHSTLHSLVSHCIKIITILLDSKCMDRFIRNEYLQTFSMCKGYHILQNLHISLTSWSTFRVNITYEFNDPTNPIFYMQPFSRKCCPSPYCNIELVVRMYSIFSFRTSHTAHNEVLQIISPFRKTSRTSHYYSSIFVEKILLLTMSHYSSRHFLIDLM